MLVDFVLSSPIPFHLCLLRLGTDRLEDLFCVAAGYDCTRAILFLDMAGMAMAWNGALQPVTIQITGHAPPVAADYLELGKEVSRSPGIAHNRNHRNSTRRWLVLSRYFHARRAAEISKKRRVFQAMPLMTNVFPPTNFLTARAANARLTIDCARSTNAGKGNASRVCFTNCGPWKSVSKFPRTKEFPECALPFLATFTGT